MLVIDAVRLTVAVRDYAGETLYASRHTHIITENGLANKFDAYIGTDAMGAKVLNYRDSVGNIVEVRVSQHVLRNMIQDDPTEMPLARSVPVPAEESGDTIHFRYQTNEDDHAPMMSEVVGLGFRRGNRLVTGVHVWRDLVGKGRPVFVCHKNKSVQITESVPKVVVASVELDFVEFRLAPAIWSSLGVRKITAAKTVKPGEVVTITGFMNGAVVKTYGRVKRYEGRPMILGHTASTIPSFSGGAIKNAKGEVVGVHLRHGPIGSDINLGIDYTLVTRIVKATNEESGEDGGDGAMTRINSSEDEVSNAEQLARIYDSGREVVIRGARGNAYVDVVDVDEPVFAGGSWGDFEELVEEYESKIGSAFTSKFAAIADAYDDEPYESSKDTSEFERALIDALIHRTPEDIERAVRFAKGGSEEKLVQASEHPPKVAGTTSEASKKRRKRAAAKAKKAVATTSVVKTASDGTETLTKVVVPVAVKPAVAPVAVKEKEKKEENKAKAEKLPSTEESAKEKVTLVSAPQKSHNQQSTPAIPTQNLPKHSDFMNGLMEKVLGKKCSSSSQGSVTSAPQARKEIPRTPSKRVKISPSSKSGSGRTEDPKQS
jgi:hypothetical protein